MIGSKLFTASIVVLALALGFFLGNLKAEGGFCCNKGTPCECTQGKPCSCEKNGQPCHCPNCAKHGQNGPQHMGEHRGPHGDFNKGPAPMEFKGSMNPEAIDSMLQVTPEQKAAIEANRVKGDSIFKDLRKNKHEAEKALGEAIESGDQKAIEAAKVKVLDADKALLEHRINGVNVLAGILSKEQREKFNQFHKEQMKNFREFKKNGSHGPKGAGPMGGPHGGPHGNHPPMPPQE